MRDTTTTRLRSLDPLFHPRSIAVIGASDDPLRIGGRPIAYALQLGYTGKIYPVNPKRETVQGLPAYARIGDVPDHVDCAIIAVPGPLVADAMRACAAKRVRGIVLFSGGFAELGEDGRRLQEEIGRIAREGGMRLLGPNCIGAFSVPHRAFPVFLSGVTGQVPAARVRIGLASQSGGYGGHILKLAEQRGLAVHELVTTGNEADVEVGEVIHWMAESPDIDLILAYVEGVRSKEAFIAGLAAAHRNRKPVVLMKVGATEAGAAAAASHTAALAGADGIYDAVIREYGAYRAGCTEEVLDIACALSAGKPLLDRKLGVISISGGAAVQIADFACAAGLRLEPPDAGVQRRLREISPFGSPLNPVDITAQVGNQPEIFEDTLEQLVEAGYDAILAWLGPSIAHPRAGARMREALERMSRKRPDVLVTISVMGEPAALAALRDAGCLLYEEPRRAITALAALDHFQRAFSTPLPARPGLHGVELLEPDTVFNEVQGKQVLARAGVPLLDERLVRTAGEAAAAARAIGRPVAVKVVSADIVHKSDIGGVALGLATPQDAADAVTRMAAAMPRRAPGARIDGYLVSPMLADGVECIVGVHADPLFGPVVMFGIGGVLVEVMQDVAFALAPLDLQGALDLVRRVKGHRLLTGFRGKPPADIAALAKALVAISKLAARNADRLHTLEVNPVYVLPEGQGVVALDAVVQTGAVRPPRPEAIP
ncbi:acetate--CoA ligase family protein [Pseudorhodoferax sp.]|uniref:acetate--CoA ligase family protein n=1 Tax=Pseudorhodoferax sp. TaxID=1993553 RepID=UPI002DD635D5|nr:acetate--CoA ligase family protein [Pseudorhodoferax sp.]